MFFFTHIEKCAGTTFNEILSLTYPWYFHITKNKYGGNELRNDLDKSQFKRILRYMPKGIGGHSVRPYLDFIDPTKSFTFLRNPIERYMSQYNHDHERGFSPDIDFFNKRTYTENFMVQKLAGENDFQKASAFLQSYIFVGDVDNFVQSINALSDVLNINFYGSVSRKNVRKNKKNYLKFEDLSEAQKKMVLEKNKLDIKLYENFILKKNVFSNYSQEYNFRKPSKLRIKVIDKLNDFKKDKIIKPIRLS